MIIKKCYDVESLSKLYYDFLYETYSIRCTATIDICKKHIDYWITSKLDVYGLYNAKEELVGFSLAYIDTEGGILKPAYRAEITYVIPEYRKTKWSYKLLKLPIDTATLAGIPVVSKSTVYNKVNNIHRKFGGQLIFEERILEC